MDFDVGMDDQVRRQPGQRIAQDRQLDAAQPRFDGHRPAAGDLHAAADQGGDVHGAAIDVEQLAFEAVLGEDAAVLRDPEKGLGGVHRRVGNAQLVGGEILSREARRSRPIPARRASETGVCGFSWDCGYSDSATAVKGMYSYDRWQFLDNSKDGLLGRPFQ